MKTIQEVIVVWDLLSGVFGTFRWLSFNHVLHARADLPKNWKKNSESKKLQITSPRIIFLTTSSTNRTFTIFHILSRHQSSRSNNTLTAAAMNDENQTTANTSEPKLCKMGCGFFVSLNFLRVLHSMRTFVRNRWLMAVILEKLSNSASSIFDSIRAAWTWMYQSCDSLFDLF